MGFQPQDTRVDRATSRWWRTPVASACLKTLAVTGFAGVAWLLGGSSAAHADTSARADAQSVGADVVSFATDLVAAPSVAPVTNQAKPVLRSITRPLAAMAVPVPQTVTAAVSPARGSAGGALAPATTPASGALDGLRAIARNTTPALGSTVQVEALGLGQSPTRALPIGTALTSVMRDRITPFGTDQSVGMVQPLTGAVQPLIADLHDIGLPRGGPSQLTGSQLVDAPGGRFAPPLPWAVPAQGTARPDSIESAPAAQGAHTVDGVYSPAVGVRKAPTLPAPAPGNTPAAPVAGMNSGSAAGSFASQFDGSSGVVGAGIHSARLLAARVVTRAVESGVPLVRAEDLAATPD